MKIKIVVFIFIISASGLTYYLTNFSKEETIIGIVKSIDNTQIKIIIMDHQNPNWEEPPKHQTELKNNESKRQDSDVTPKERSNINREEKIINISNNTIIANEDKQGTIF